ncbi:CoA-binding protein [Paenibacillus swuensis]|uniref:CoA-binding protein n=1 Tax=Paenibacillus swuensis TaxID=1178515 RepID=A0A172TKI5_9BACL|nr:CoA-binding protein [Paenibacillus swuensis]ANE47434.1 CoA-binding protein [Paenibacillus swuensis]
MTFENPAREEIKKILERADNVAVVGLSDNPERTSYMVAQAMQARGYRIIPVNPNADEILGEKSYPTLKDIPESIDIVNVFRRSEHTPPIAQEAVEAGAKVLWLQLGIANEEAAQIAESGGLTVIMDRCIKVEDAITGPLKK